MANDRSESKPKIIERVPKRILLGPGPSEVDPEVVRALTLPSLGHLDPALLEMMNEIQEMLRGVFGTKNKLTLALSGTGTSGMEAALANVVDEGDPVVACINGYFGERLAQIAERQGGVVTRLEVEWGKRNDPHRVRETILRVRPRVVCAVHAETSTGVLQDVDALAEAAHEVDAVFVADAVTSLGGHPVKVDEWGIDVCYSGSQKCLGAPSGLAPFTMNDRALDKARDRKTPIRTFYLDATLLEKYWDERQYHHTISAPLVYALHTALALLEEEGMERRWKRHYLNHQALRAGAEAMGLHYLPPEEISLWPLNAILVPEGADEAKIRADLLSRFGIEIGGGLGPLKGKLLRIGLMGYGSQQMFVLQLLAALESVLKSQDCKINKHKALPAAMGVYGG